MHITSTASRRASAVLAAAVGAALLVPTAASAAPQPPTDPKPVPQSQQGKRSATTAAGELTAKAAAETGAVFTPLDPQRVLDTRESGGALGNGQTRTLNLAGVVPEDTISVVLNVTAVTGANGSYVTAYPTGYERPVASNLNVPANTARPNAVSVVLGDNLSVNLYNQFGPTHLVADLAGYYRLGDGDLYNAVSPVRMLDTRYDGGGAIPARGVRQLNVRNYVPATATAVVMNLTGVGATQGTYISAYPNGLPTPTASSLNLAPGQVAPNLVTVQIGKGGLVNLYNHNGSANVVADLAGYYDSASGAEFFPIEPTRIVDTRGPGGSKVAPNWYIPFEGGAEFAEYSAITFNLTGTEPTEPTFLVAWPESHDLPVASNLNLVTNETAANLVTVAFDEYKNFGVLNRYGYVHMIWDVAGLFGTVIYRPSTK